MMARTALALRHVAFEDLGAFAAVLSAAGFETRYCEIGTPEIGTPEIGALDPVAPDLVVVLGGPVWERLAGVLGDTVAARVASDPVSTSTRAIVVRRSLVGLDVAAVGAACLLLDGAFAARPARMMIAL